MEHVADFLIIMSIISAVIAAAYFFAMFTTDDLVGNFSPIEKQYHKLSRRLRQINQDLIHLELTTRPSYMESGMVEYLGFRPLNVKQLKKVDDKIKMLEEEKAQIEEVLKVVEAEIEATILRDAKN